MYLSIYKSRARAAAFRWAVAGSSGLSITIVIHSFMALPSVQDRSEDGNESVSLERSETYPSDQ